MIRKLKYAIIADIATFDLSYFDDQEESQSIDICNANGYTYLPSRCEKFVYKLENDHFKKVAIEMIDDNLKVNPSDLIFNSETIAKFGKQFQNEVRFLIDKEEVKDKRGIRVIDKIIGVIHIVDYNNDFISIELFKAILQFEKNLRQLLVMNGKNNNDFISWVKEKAESAKQDSFWARRLYQLNQKKDERENANPFQTFNLKELLQFAVNINLLNKKDFNAQKIGDMRNLVAHNKDVVSKKEDEDSIVYLPKGLNVLAEQMKAFFKAYEILAKKVKK